MSSLFHRAMVCALCAFLMALAPKSESAPDDPQKLVEIIDERAGNNTFNLVAVSKVDYPVTVNVDLPTLENLKATTEPPYSVVVQPKKRTVITKLQRQHARRATRYASSYTCYAGWRDPKQSADFVYTLPFEPGYAYRIGQGFNGQFSHQGKNAIDFNMPEGAMICAARDGVVIEATQSYSKGGLDDEFKDKANRVLILHDDGTLARYAHLLHNGARVKVGQRVKTGEPIALVGATGYAKGPHLHFEIDRPPAQGDNQYETLSMIFEMIDESGQLVRATPTEGTTVQRPGARGVGARKSPPNTIDEIVLCRDVVDDKVIEPSDVFRSNMSMVIALRIGAPAERTLRLTLQRDDGNAKSPALFDHELKTSDDVGFAWLKLNLADEKSLRGRLILRVFVDQEQLAEKRFRVQ